MKTDFVDMLTKVPDVASCISFIASHRRKSALPMKRLLAIASFASLAVTANATNRLWNPADEANKDLADGANWDPTFVFGTDDISADELVINCTTGATLATDFSTKTLFVGRGVTLNDGSWSFSAYSDLGAKLDVSAGTLTATDTLWVGGGYADYRDCILNLSGTGKIVAGNLKTGDCASRTDDSSHTNIRYDDGNGDNMKANYINVDAGTSVVVSNETLLSTYSGGTTFVNINGGTWENVKELRVGSGGDAVFTLNSGTVNLSTSPDQGEAFVGRGGGSKTCKLVVNGGVFNSQTLQVGRDGNTGEVDFTSGISVISNSAWYDTLNLGWGSNSRGTMKVSGDADLTVWGKMVVGRSNKGGSAYFEMSGGSLNITNHDIYVAQDSDSVGSMKMTGGEAVVNYFIVGNRGTAAVELSGGTLKTRSNVRIGDQSVYEEYDSETGAVTKHENAGVGTLTLKTGGTFEVGGTLYVGNSGTGTFTLDGGTLTTSGNITIANDANSTGTIHVVSGTLRGGNDLYVGMRGTGVLTLDGGTAACPYWCNFNRDSASTAEGSTINLNQGGTLNIGSIHNSGTKMAAFNWNGGVLKPYGTDEYVFEDVEKYDVNVLRHGAILDTTNQNTSLNVALTGDGNFVLRGGKECWVKKAADLKRGVRVEAGTLVFEQGLATETTATTPIKEIYVASGASLDLKGNLETKPTIYVESFTNNGVEQESGTYDAYNATIIVIASGNTVATATWTGDAGDGDLTNPDNWECYNADGVLLFDAVPPAATTATLTVPYVGTSLAEYRAIKAAFPDATCVLGVAGSQKLDITPNVVRSAIAWYDFADSDTATVSEGAISAIANKGTKGSLLDATSQHATKSLYGETTLNGHNVMSMTNSHGLVTVAGNVGLSGADDRTLVAIGRTQHEKYLKSDGENYMNECFYLGIEAGGDDGAFRIEDRSGDSYQFQYSIGDNSWWSLYPNVGYAKKNDWHLFIMRSEYNSGEGKSFVSAKVIDENGIVTQPGDGESTAMVTKADSRIAVGMRYEFGSASAGDLAEAMVFDKALSSAEQSEIQSYLNAKWFGAATGNLAPTDFVLSDGAMLDLDGYSVTLDSVSGTGTITNFSKATIGGVTIDGTSGDAAVVKDGAVISQKWLTKNGKTVDDLDSVAANTKYSVYQCYLAGLDPANEEAEFKLADAEMGADGKVTSFTLPAKPNGTPVVQYNTTSASSDSWSSEGLTTSIDDKTVTVTGTWPEWTNVLFYRVTIQP